MSDENTQLSSTSVSQNSSVNRPSSGGITDAVHFLDYWQILYSRKEIVIAVALIMVFTGIVVTRAMPKVYQATALIQVQREHRDIDPYAQQRVGYDPYFLRTQFEIIRSVPIMEEVVREMNLNEILGRAYGYYDRMSSTESSARTVSLLRGKLGLDIYRDTDLIAISIKLDKPDEPEGEAARLAASTANMVAKVFKEWTLRQSREDKESALKVLQQELDEQDRKIAAQDEKIRQLREKYGLTILTEGDTGAQAIRSEIAMLNTERARAELRMNNMRSDYEQIKDMDDNELAGYLRILTGDGTVDSLVAQRQAAEIKLNTLRREYGEKHPEVQQTRNTLEEIEAMIKSRVQDVKFARELNYKQALDLYKDLNEKLENLKKRELEYSSSGVIDYINAMTERRTLKENRAVLESSYNRERVQLRLPATSVRIIESAKVEGTPLPISPNFALNIMLSIVAGLFFGVVLTFFVEYLDTSVKTVDDVEKYIGAKVIGLIPQKILSLNNPSAPATHAEPYRVLRTNLKTSQINAPEGQGAVLSVTSASVGEGKTQTLFNLAYACADIGDKICLVDTDLHRPRQHKILGLRRSPGIANVIVGEATLDEAILHTSLPNLDFIPAGELSGANVHGLLDTDEFAAALATLRKRYDKVLLDSPPMVGVSDASQLVRMVDGVIMVVQQRKYPRAMIRRGKDMVVNMGGNLLGVVLNNINVARDYSSYYYKHQYYSGGYGSGKSKSGESRRRSRKGDQGDEAKSGGSTPEGATPPKSTSENRKS